MRAISLRKKLHFYQRRMRQARMVASAIQSRHIPVLAHIIPMRRCNLSCAYCNEYDNVSAPVPTETMLRRIDLLARLGTKIITISGGEPLLHPDLDDIIRGIRSHDAIATMITNGLLLTPERIERLNRAGLEHLQISIDNVNPDEVSKKSLRVLDRKLEWLKEFAEFDININSVLGGGIPHSEDALTITRRAVALAFDTSVGVIHDHGGQVQPLKDQERAVYDQILAERKPGLFAFAYDNLYQKNLIGGQPNDWQCGAGSRYLYICEDGLVHYCSQQRGYPAIPLGKIHPRRYRPRILHQKAVRPILHGLVCASRRNDRPHSQSAARVVASLLSPCEPRRSAVPSAWLARPCFHLFAGTQRKAAECNPKILGRHSAADPRRQAHREERAREFISIGSQPDKPPTQ